jgi:IS6 family transposase
MTGTLSPWRTWTSPTSASRSATWETIWTGASSRAHSSAPSGASAGTHAAGRRARVTPVRMFIGSVALADRDRRFADETYIKVAGRWTYLYRAVDQHGQAIDMLLSQRRDLAASRRFFTRALRADTTQAEVTTDRAPAYPRVLDELIPSALHTVERYANNPVETDHGRLKARLRPMRGLKRHRSARIVSAGHAFVQNLRRGHYEIATDIAARHRVPAAFGQLATAI